MSGLSFFDAEHYFVFDNFFDSPGIPIIATMIDKHESEASRLGTLLSFQSLSVCPLPLCFSFCLPICCLPGCQSVYFSTCLFIRLYIATCLLHDQCVNWGLFVLCLETSLFSLTKVLWNTMFWVDLNMLSRTVTVLAYTWWNWSLNCKIFHVGHLLQ